jgi:hypothetical protein
MNREPGAYKKALQLSARPFWCSLRVRYPGNQGRNKRKKIHFYMSVSGFSKIVTFPLFLFSLEK